MSDLELIALNEAGPQLRAPIATDRGTITLLLVSGTLTGPSGSWSSTGLNLASGDSYFIDSNNVLSQIALGSTVLSSSLTSLGTIASLVATSADINAGTIDGTNIGVSVVGTGAFSTGNFTGTITGPSGAWDSGGMDIATGDSYAIDSTDVLTATALGTGVLASSITSTGILNSGSITSGFGNIDNGSSTLGSGTHTIASGSDITVVEGKISITDTANEDALRIISSHTTSAAINITVGSVTAGFAILAATNNSGYTNVNGLINSTVDNTGASGHGIVSQQDGTGFSYVGRVAAVIKFQVDGPDGDVNNTNGTYGTISDRKTKENITEGVRSYTDDFLNLQYHKYQRKDDIAREEAEGIPAPWLLGLIADEVFEVFPGCVKGYVDTEEVVTGQDDNGDILEFRPVLDGEGNQTVTQSVKSSIIDGTINSIVLQEQIKELRALKAELKAAGVIA